MKEIIKEPLVFFFIIGLVVFGLHTFLNKENQDDTDPYTIDVTSADIDYDNDIDIRTSRKFKPVNL